MGAPVVGALVVFVDRRHLAGQLLHVNVSVCVCDRLTVNEKITQAAAGNPNNVTE